MLGTSGETVVFPGIISLDQISYTNTQQLGYQGLATTTTSISSGNTTNMVSASLLKGVWNVEGQIQPSITPGSFPNNYSISLSSTGSVDATRSLTINLQNVQYVQRISSIFVLTITTTISCFATLAAALGGSGASTNYLRYTKIG